jgi:signal transduction histidine kinase/ActR/RegA family two-component response regulator
VSSRLIEYGGGKAILSAARDVSRRLEMERQLHQQERLAAVGQLAGGIAHDFRNFLTTIILYAGMPMGRPDLSPVTREALEVISREAHQASDLVQQILDFSGRSAMEAQPVDLVAFVEEAVDILRQTIPESIRVSLSIEPTESIVEADPTRIQQMLMNLALNARDAMISPTTNRASEGGRLGIALSKVLVSPDEPPPVARMEPGEWVRLTVSDTGTGMSQEVKNRIFEPFFTTKKRGEGTGLGLAQVYGIVQQHHGHIDVETELGVGTAFHVYLPVHPATVEESGQRSDSMPGGNGEMVLLVEDQENLREAGRGMLTSLGYRVLTAANGQEALELLTGLQVDLVVTDVVMPEMGGRALLQELTELRPGLPVLAVTGYTMNEEVMSLTDLGFVDVLQKPFDACSLAQGVRRALDGK